MFCTTIESGTAATVQLPLLVPSPPSATLDKEKQRLEARCPPLDPCKIGDYYMEGKCFRADRRAPSLVWNASQDLIELIDLFQCSKK